MKIALLSAYPLADTHYHRKLLLHELFKLREEGLVTHIFLLYAGIMPGAYWQQLQRMGGIRRAMGGIRHVSQQGGSAHRATESVVIDSRYAAESERVVLLPRGFTWRYAHQHAVPVRLFRRFGDAHCLRWFDEHKVDLAINLSGLYLPQQLLEKPRLGVQGAHYGLLPKLRGGDTLRWTIYTNQPLAISHQLIAPQMDRGDILRLNPLPVYRGETISQLRRRCQLAAVRGHIHCVRQWADKTIKRIPQREEEGQTYYIMGERLRHKTDQLLKEGRYDHHTDA